MSEYLKIAETLGISADEIVDRVVSRIADQVMTSTGCDEDGELHSYPSSFSRKVYDAVKQRIDEKVGEIAEAHILPKVSTYIENLTLQETNRWGEKTGASKTFIEYLTERAEAYLQEPVNYEGKPKSASGGFSWSASQTRLTHMVHEHLQYSIETAMKESLNIATGGVAKALHETVRLKLNEVAASLKVEVKTR